MSLNDLNSVVVRVLRFTFCLAMLNGLVACGFIERESRRTAYDVEVYPYDSENEATEAAQNWTVSCRDSRKCPDTVAQMVVRVGNEIGVCTATLIANDTVITNSHCFDLTEKAYDAQSLCSKGAAFVFASNSRKGREVAECGSVVVKSKISSSKVSDFRSPDYMILKLKKPLGRGYEKFDFSGIEDGQKLEIRKVDPTGRGFGTLVVDICESKHGTFLMSSATSHQAPVHILSRCRVIGGNSGSSLYDGQGKIRGLIFAATNEERLNSLKDLLPPGAIQILQELRPSYATNAVCISNLPGHSTPPRCLYGRTEDENVMKSEDSEIQLLELMELDKQQFRSDPRFGYDINVTSDFVFTYKPVCYKPVYVTNSASIESVPVLRWSYGVELDQDLKFKGKVDRSLDTCRYMILNGTDGKIQARGQQPHCRDAEASTGDYEIWQVCP